MAIINQAVLWMCWQDISDTSAYLPQGDQCHFWLTSGLAVKTFTLVEEKNVSGNINHALSLLSQGSSICPSQPFRGHEICLVDHEQYLRENRED